ncbi:SET domain-containing protein [Jatrophihabitans fulvus]
MTVRRSDIAGSGTFADDGLAVGDVAVRFDADVESVAGLGPLNHSCDPNLGWTDGRTLVARRDVAAGDELTLDYATLIADEGYVLWCHCETYRCRQVVEGTDHRIPQLQQRYAGHWAPRVRALIEGQ